VGNIKQGDDQGMMALAVAAEQEQRHARRILQPHEFNRKDCFVHVGLSRFLCVVDISWLLSPTYACTRTKTHVQYTLIGLGFKVCSGLRFRVCLGFV
jgi:predicted HD phosphohydrolase